MIDEKAGSKLLKVIQKAVEERLIKEDTNHATVTAALYSALTSWISLERDDDARRELVRNVQSGLPKDVEAFNGALPPEEEDAIGDTRGTA